MRLAGVRSPKAEMTHLVTWLGLLGGLVVYRLLFPTNTSLMEHVTGIYYAGVALLLHWLLTVGLKSRKPAAQERSVTKADEAAC